MPESNYLRILIESNLIGEKSLSLEGNTLLLFTILLFILVLFLAGILTKLRLKYRKLNKDVDELQELIDEKRNELKEMEKKIEEQKLRLTAKEKKRLEKELKQIGKEKKPKPSRIRHWELLEKTMRE